MCEGRYWIVVTDMQGELLFRVTDEGIFEFGSSYTPAKAKELFATMYGGEHHSFPDATGFSL